MSLFRCPLHESAPAFSNFIDRFCSLGPTRVSVKATGSYLRSCSSPQQALRTGKGHVIKVALANREPVLNSPKALLNLTRLLPESQPGTPSLVRSSAYVAF